MARYKSRRQYKSRLASQEAKRMKRQTIIIIFVTIAMLALLVIVGIPLLSRFALFIGGLGNSQDANQTTDTLPPQTPVLASSPDATNSSTLNITGVSEPSSTVTLYQNNQEKIKTVVDNSGRFEFLSVELNSGNNTFYAIAQDSAENESQRSVTKTIVYDTEPPNLTIDSPEDEDIIVGATRRNTVISGTTDPGAKISLNGRIIVVKSDGSFSTQFALEDGENKLNVISTDKAGNTTTETITVSYSQE